MNNKLLGLLLGGIVTAAAPTHSAAQSRQALYFDAAQQDKVIVPLAVPATGAITLEAWVYYDGPTLINRPFNTVLEFGDDAPWFGVDEGGIITVYGSASARTPVVRGGAMSARTWNHLAYTWDGTTSRIFHNGQEVASSTAAPSRAGTAMAIGKNIGGEPTWNGFIAEVMVWNAARTAAQLQADARKRYDLSASLPDAPTGLLAYFKLDEGTGQTVGNLVTGGPIGTLGLATTTEANDPTWAATPANTWTGAVSGSYADARNWSAGVVPGAADEVIFGGTAARDAELSTAVAAHNVITQPGSTFRILSGGSLTVGGSYFNNGTTDASRGDIITNGPNPQLFSGNAIAMREFTVGPAGVDGAQPALSFYIHRLLRLNGDLRLNGIYCELVAGLDGSAAMVVNNGAARVVGNVVVRRSIDEALNGGLGYRHLSAPVTGAVAGDLRIGGSAVVANPQYNTAPNPSAVTPFPTVFAYDETRVPAAAGVATFNRGWVSPSALTEALEPGRGYSANIPTGAVTFSAGTLNNGPIERTGLTRGAGPEAGWHLLGNPYPAPINWNQLTRNGVDNALYVFKSRGQYSGTYASYVNGFGTNSGTNVIPMAQGFFVRASSSAAPGSVSFTNAARLTSPDLPPLQRGTADTRPSLRLQLTSPAGTDETVTYFEQGATAGFDAAFDARKIAAGSALHLAALAGAEALAINGLPPLTAPVTVPLQVQVPQAGPYTLRATELLNLPAGWLATLRDAATGAVIDLQQQPAYPCVLTPGQLDGRFSVVFAARPTASTLPLPVEAQVALYPNPARTTATLSVFGSTKPVAVRVCNALGQVVLTQTIPASPNMAISLPLAALPKGVYTVRVALPAGPVTKRLVVE